MPSTIGGETGNDSVQLSGFSDGNSKQVFWKTGP